VDHRSLRNALRNLYPDARSALIVTEDAGLNSRVIDWSGPTDILWVQIIDEALRADRLDVLVRVASYDYPNNAELAEAARLLSPDPLESAQRSIALDPARMREWILARNGVLVLGSGLTGEGPPAPAELLWRVLDVFRGRESSRLQRVRSKIFELAESAPARAWRMVEAGIEAPELVSALAYALRRNSDRIAPSLINRIASLNLDVIDLNWSSTFHGARRGCAPTAPADRLEVLLSGAQAFHLKLFGGLESSSGFAATIEGFRASLARNELLQKFLTTLVSSRPLLFSMTDVDTIEAIAESLPFWDSSSQRHFVLAERGAITEAQASYLRARFNIEAVELDATPDALERAFEALSPTRSATPGGLESFVAVPPDLGVPRLEEVTLTNIGPFERLIFNPGASWNVVVGNNARGKTTLLRAIALGLAGDDPSVQEVASSLLRAGANAGVIELRIQGVSYRTELFREGPTVRAKSFTVTLLQTARLPVLGFPAIRGVSQQQAAPQSSESSGAPNASKVRDLLPILRGVVDARFDAVRAWIARTELRAQNLSRQGDHAAAERLRDASAHFFRILGEMLDGVSLALHEVDPNTWQVWVTANGVVVPIEALSQGTSAILGWVGATFVRLTEENPTEPEPWLLPALVLIDEVDAHMHPRWQQTIVPLVRKHLRNLQVIATTHSPLVVTNLDGMREVFVLEGDSSQQLMPAGTSFEGWRADQVLTGPAFGLARTTSDDTLRVRERYRELLGRAERTPEEESEFAELTARLEAMPGPGETSAAREALALVQAAVAERRTGEAERARVVAEARELLARIGKVDDASG
jgi:predicted ATP-binding protein involved in virulence